MIASLQLPFQFDRRLLKTDLARIRTEEWTPHYNERDYGGAWSGVALRSLTGDAHQLHAREAGPDAYADTDVLLRCPYFQEVLAAFVCPLKSVRLLRLAPGSVIREHTDPALGFDDGEVRIHVPIQTNGGVEFCLAGERLQFEEGHCYYVDVSLPHRVSNRGCEDRIHLVIDADVNDWVRSVFHRSQPVAASPVSSRGIDGFRKAVLNDPVLQQRLHAAEERREFIDLAAELARERGFNVEDRDLEPGRCIPSTENVQVAGFRAGWFPVEVRFQAASALAEWVYFGSRRFTEPFFENTVRAALRNPFARAFRYEAPLCETSEMSPAGFIFHMSRCGSTLIAQTLASLPGTVVISEAAPIDSAIQANSAELLRRTVNALGQCRFGETHYFVKLDAWHIHNLPLIREAFPDAPWIFVYRNPVEVLVSQLCSPGRPALPGAMDPEALGLSFSHITSVGREEWCARVLAGFCRSALAFRDDPQALFVNYRQLPGAVWNAISNHFFLDITSDELTRMHNAAQFDAKQPARPFQPDSDGKHRAATASVRELAANWLNPLYSELQKLTPHV
ncbi:MAG: aspartyl/asparaginyl beta-hydroxylase domain-containing protein [Bryobacteraceae bacterium]